MQNAAPAGARPPDTGAEGAASEGIASGAVAPGAVASGTVLGLYAAVARGAFRRYSTYRAATLAGTFTNTVFGIILASSFLALWQARPNLGGYDQGQAVTYIWVSQAMLVTVSVWGGGFQDELQDRFRSGDIAVDLYRPVDFQAWWLATDLGRAGFQVLVRGTVPLLVGALVFRTRMPEHALTWVFFLFSVLLALLVSFGMRFLVSITGFWLHDSEGVRAVMLVVSMFFSGMLLPIALFPGPLGDLAGVLPWAALIKVPTDVFLERADGAGLLAALGSQLGWAAVLLAAGRGAQWLATRRVVVQGG
ncbi:ABC transporter permease [Streptomyces sp. CBMA123]|uniref:ABC transporter permease n=1 Tax=Streptomyces sp. CBMA123 TaxID=1896313 RepID=UPI001661E94C|nr:ABC-2 family transporter protein [Streptomyces sp. CBMA123]